MALRMLWLCDLDAVRRGVADALERLAHAVDPRAGEPAGAPGASAVVEIVCAEDLDRLQVLAELRDLLADQELSRQARAELDALSSLDGPADRAWRALQDTLTAARRGVPGRAGAFQRPL